MNNTNKTKSTVNDLNEKIKLHFEELAQETDKARQSEGMMRFLDFCAKLHRYSPSNIWLILMAKPDASHVAGYTAWKKMGRYVNKGEKGIPIFAPMFYRDDPDNEDSPKVLRGFRVVYVFDISQTGGQPLPEQPNWKSPEKNMELQENLIEFAENNGIKVTIEPLSGETQGVSMGGSIVLSPEAGVKTLVHEIAHELLHQVENDQPSSQIKEMEAESIAYIVCSWYGLLDLSCPNYLALHGLDGSKIMGCFHKINVIAKKIIFALNGEGK